MIALFIMLMGACVIVLIEYKREQPTINLRVMPGDEVYLSEKTVDKLLVMGMTTPFHKEGWVRL